MKFMRENRNKFLISLAIFGFVASGFGQAAVTFGQYTTGGGGGGVDQTQGWEFIPQTDVSVVRLGLYDGSFNPVGGGFQQPHEVAIWNASGDLIASTAIPQGAAATLENNFRYENIAATELFAGQTYVIGAFMPTPVDDYTVVWTEDALANGIVSFDPRIQFVAYREGPSPGGISFPGSTFPGYVGAFGPNFIVAVPEPSIQIFALATGILGVIWMRKRRDDLKEPRI